MRAATQKDREETRRYLLGRMEAVESMSRGLERLMGMAIEEIVRICFKFNLRPEQLNRGEVPGPALAEINAVVDWLREMIEDSMEALVGSAPEGDREGLLAWVKRKRDGMTFGERLHLYCERFRLEMFLLTAAGIAVGLGSVPLVRSLVRNLRRPWVNGDIRDGLERVPSYGVGRSNVMFNALNALTRDGVASGWMKAKYLGDRERGCIGWMVERGSSVPCDVCDPQTGFHYTDSALPLYHLSCMCMAVPVFGDKGYRV